MTEVAEAGTPMESYLRELLVDGPQLVQILFVPGVSQQAGHLHHGPRPGLFTLKAPTQATANTPGGFRAGDTVMAEMTFGASAVLYLMTFDAEQPNRRPPLVVQP